MKARTKRQWRLAGLLVLCTAGIWVAWPTPFVYPLKIFVVMLHEISHAIAGLATGGRVQRITLDPYQGGATYVRGGNAFVMLSAGYLGSLLWGLALVRLSRGPTKRVRVTTMAVGLLLLLVSAAVVRGWFGLPFGLLFGLALVVLARKASVPVQRTLLLVLGLTSAMYALLDIRSDVLDRPGLRSDAFMLAELTGVPTIAWGLLWIGLGAIACGVALRNEFRKA